MSSRLLEDCSTLETSEENEWTEFIVLKTTGKGLIVVDPFALNMQDLINAKPESVALVRVRRPFWGQGNMNRFIYKLEL